ncbi:MAG: hypothetical protein KAW09_01885, partial [Thermoplasmata archaeon]|nr:hypothetical protein [Thermoplasmata archaeon]
MFEKLDTKRGYIKTKRLRPEEEIERPHHLIFLPEGSSPKGIRLSSYKSFCWAVFGKRVERNKEKIKPELEEDLVMSHIQIRPEEYVAYAMTTALIVAIISVFLAVLLFFLLFMPALGLIIGLILMILIVVLPPFLTYVVVLSSPGRTRKRRERLIDANISGAMSFISAMASAQVPVDVIFKELSKESVYGEVSEEAKWIT